MSMFNACTCAIVYSCVDECDGKCYLRNFILTATGIPIKNDNTVDCNYNYDSARLTCKSI